MKTYTQKAAGVEAALVDQEAKAFTALINWLTPRGYGGTWGDEISGGVFLNIPKVGQLRAPYGSYVVRDARGHLSVWSAAEFEAAFEAA